MRSLEPNPRRFLFLLPAIAGLLALAHPAFAADYSPRVKKGVNSIKGQEIQYHCDVLASDQYEGREGGTRGAFRAGCYIAREFEKAGLKPGGDGGGWFQTFSLGRGGARGGEIGNAHLLEIQFIGRCIQVKHFDYTKDFIPFRFSGKGYASGEVVFAGYGISAEEYGYDDYRGLDVKGKIVIVLSHEPQEDSADSVFAGTELTRHADPLNKARLALEKGAAALLVVPNPAHHGDDALAVEGLTTWPPKAEAAEALAIPCIRCLAGVAREILKPERKKLDRLQTSIDRGLKPCPVKMKKCRVALRVRAQPDPAGCGRNVVGIFEGRDPALKEEYVVLGAHYDHIGFGHFASRGRPGEVHNGANDNASGTAGLMALARAVAEFEVELKRTLVFVAFDGEEKGLLGSKHYVSKPTVPLDKIVAMLNMDMIGRGPIRKIKVGGGTLNQTLHVVLKRISARFQLGLDLDGLDAFLRNSDQAPFMDKSIPCIFLSSGLFNGLHSHEDDSNLLNLKKMEAIVRTMMLVAVEVADLKKRP